MHTPTEPASGAGGLIPHQEGSPKQKPKGQAEPPQPGGTTGSLSGSSKLCFLHAWLERGDENHLSTHAMSPGTEPSTLSQPFLGPQAAGPEELGEHSRQHWPPRSCSSSQRLLKQSLTRCHRLQGRTDGTRNSALN